MWRSATIQARSASGSSALRFGRAPARQAGIQGVELRGDGLERLAFRGCAGSVLLALAERVVLGETRCRRRRQLGLEIDADRCRDRAAGSLRLEQEPRRAVERRDEDRGLAEQRRAGRAVPGRPCRDPAREVARDRRPCDERRRPEQHGLPAGKLPQGVERAAHAGALVGAQLDHDALPLRAGREELE